MPRRSNVARASFSRTPKLADEEMALIMGRTVGMPITSEMVRKFVPAARAAQESPDVDIEIIDLPDGTSCCYDSINGVCACPC